MSNHPNRGWRKRADNTADQWLTTSEATGLVVALGALPEWGRNQHARDLLRRAYLAGYVASRHPEYPWCPRCKTHVPTIDEGETCARCKLVL